jgi:hypothetical protein
MKPVSRDQVQDYVTYEEQRDASRTRILEEKRLRRVHVAGVFTFLFENPDTVLYQIQEMIRTERIVKEADIRHEIETYNELLGGDGELGCTLLIEIDSPEERKDKLERWLALPRHVYLKMEDGSRVRARFDERQVGETRLSSVQYFKFDVRGAVPVAIGVDLPDLAAETLLEPPTRAALYRDLAN